MLKLNVNQEKQLTFEAKIGGVQADQVTGYLRLLVDDVEYGFPAKVGQESITVELPALRAITTNPLKEGTEIKARLDVVVDGNYISPWSDSITIVNPLVVEAKIVGYKSKPLSESTKRKIAKEKLRQLFRSKEENITESAIDRIAQKLGESYSEPKPKVKKISVKDILNITEEGVYEYMERAGTKNPNIQKLIYEQAEAAAHSSRPVKVLAQVVKILKK